MAYTSETIKDLIRLGGRLTISGSYTSENLKDFIRLANTHNVRLTIRVEGLKTETLKDLIRISNNNLTLEL